MSEDQDPNVHEVHIRPRDPDWREIEALEKQRAKLHSQRFGGAEKAVGLPSLEEALLKYEASDSRRAQRAGPNMVFGLDRRDVTMDDIDTLSRAVATLTMELEGLARHVTTLGSAVASLMDVKAQFGEEDVAAIKAHVRHPGALEAARLRETIRCALAAAEDNSWIAVKKILGETDAKE